MDNSRNYLDKILDWLYYKKEAFLDDEFKCGIGIGAGFGLAVALIVAIVFVIKDGI